MPHHLKKCSQCAHYSISEDKCDMCGSPLINVYPPKFSIEDKYQKYRMDYFKEKMVQKFPEIANKQ